MLVLINSRKNRFCRLLSKRKVPEKMAVDLNPCSVTMQMKHTDRITGWEITCSEHGYLKTLRTREMAINAARDHIQRKYENG